jgi:hypothetical protein
MLFYSAPLKTLAGNHITCSLCDLPYATIQLDFLYNENNISSSVEFSVGDSHRKFIDDL